MPVNSTLRFLALALALGVAVSPDQRVIAATAGQPIGQDAIVVAPGIYSRTPLGFGQLTLTSTAVLLSTVQGGIPNGARLAVLTVETNDLRWRDDGTAPTATVGMLIVHGNYPPFEYHSDLSKLQLIAVSGSPVVDISFY
jgi:hypothetical protein